MTKLFAIAGHFVSYRWVSGLHNFLVILWNLLKTKKNFHQRKQTTNESNNCWSRLNASQAARHSFVGRMFVTPVPHKNANSNVSWLYLLFTQKLQCRWCDRLPNGMIWAVVTMKRTRKVNTNAHRSSRVSRPRSGFRQRVPVEKLAAPPLVFHKWRRPYFAATTQVLLPWYVWKMPFLTWAGDCKLERHFSHKGRDRTDCGSQMILSGCC